MYFKGLQGKVEQKIPIFALNPRKKTMQVMVVVEDFCI